MKSLLKYIVLTGVVLFVDSALAVDSPECVSAKSTLTTLKNKIASGRCNSANSNVTPNPNCSEWEGQLTTAQEAVTKCDEDKTKNDTECKESKDEYNKLVEKYPHGQIKKMESCLDAREDSDDSSNVPFIQSMMYAAAGQAEPAKPSCLTPHKKSDNYEVNKDFDKKIEDQDEKIADADKELIGITKKTKETVAELMEERLKLQESFEKAQQGNEDAQDKALTRVRDNQNAITDQIRKLHTDLLRMRLQEKNIDAAMRKALFKDNVQSEGAISRTCDLNYRKYQEDRNKIMGGKVTSSSKSGAAQRGYAKKQDKKSFLDDCLILQRRIRADIMESFQDQAIEFAKAINDLEKQIAQKEADFKNQVEDYNRLIEKNQQRLSQAQQKYYQNDLMIAQKIQQAQENEQLEQTRLNQAKQQAIQKKTAYYNSKGELSESDIEDAQKAKERMDELTATLDECKPRGVASKSSKKPSSGSSDAKR